MARVLARRDENWKKLQQYILEERETFQLLGPAGTPLHGFEREYRWFVRDGFFIRSPLRADGVAIDEAERRREEQTWMRREQRREARRAEPVEPRFVAHAYFLRFTFDPGRYALAGHESFDGREVLRIEYYPTKLFAEGRARPSRELRKRDEKIEEKMNKASLVTLWIDSATHQILQYEFDNIDMDFLPARSIARIDAVRASMRMGQPFEGVWLPRSLAVRFDGLTALGSVRARYDVEYYDYKLAEVTTRIR